MIKPSAGTGFAPPEELAERVAGAAVAALDLFSIHLGHRLGYYRALADDGPGTPADLARRTGTAERYAREWLEQQAVTGFLACDAPEADAERRAYRLPDGYAEAFLNPDSPCSVVGIARVVAGMLAPLNEVVAAYRSGGGVPYAAYGPDLRAGMADLSRPVFASQIGRVWLPALPDVHARLLAAPPARVADVGMGEGWSSIALARACPEARVDGFDLDPASVAAARDNAAAAGVADRVRFAVRDVADPALAGQYDLATAFDCVHDMADPVAALRAMRRLVAGRGPVLVGDSSVPEGFAPPGDANERLSYGFSLFHCLPVGMSEQPSVATGAPMRPSLFRRYAEAAGFRRVEELLVDEFGVRLYRLDG